MDRRLFVKLSGLGASATLIGTAGASILGVPASRTVNLGIIGTGDRGTGMISLIKDIAGFKIAACCDIIPFRLEKAVGEVGDKVNKYADYKALLGNKDIDAVLIATPFSMHAEMAIDALKAGKHVFCEKTMCRGVEDIQNVVKAVNTSGKIFQTGHQYRSSRLYRHVVDMVKEGVLGPISAFECQWNRNESWRRPVSDPKWERMINWRMYKEYSGGLVAELCSHQIDFINWVTESHPLKVAGFGGIDYWKDGRETYDNIHLLMEYPEGIRAKFTCLTTNRYEDYSIKIMGKKGAIVMGYENAWIYPEESELKTEFGIVDGVSGATLKASERKKGKEIKVKHRNVSQQALLDFHTAIIDNSQPESNVNTGAITAYAVGMANRSLYQGTIEKWNY